MSLSLPGPHLGPDGAALVDGELSDAGRERAHAHLAGCEQCRRDVESQRRLKATLADLSTGSEAPAPSPELLGRLFGVPAEFPSPAQQGAAAGAKPAPAARAAVRPDVRGAGPVRRRDSRGPALTTRPYRRRGTRGRYVAGSITAFTAGLALVLAVGGEGPGAGAPVRPPVTGFVQQHAVTRDEIPFSDPAEAAVTAAFSR